jgi:hemerythrin-like domain-containing protein
MVRARTGDIGRRALVGAGVLGVAALGTVVRAAGTKPARGNKQAAKDGEDVGPGEDLMREHGVLRRVLLVYQEICRRLERGGDVNSGTIQRSALLIRRFIEDYHERQEEEMVFPRFERAHKLVDLVRVLRAQHQAGRRLTERVQGLATTASLKHPQRRAQLRDELLAFVHMYEPHASREDTVLFPALHAIVSASEFDALGEDFERREHQLFGADGFDGAVAEVEAIERSVGIEDLAQFTPRR